jgi:hypothetical protein
MAARKDRGWTRILSPEARIVVRRSSAHPITYAIMLVATIDNIDYTVRTFDNAHDVVEHHEHIYIGINKQPPTIVSNGSANVAMDAALKKLLSSWDVYVDEWKGTL